MAGEWLKFECSLPEKPETLAITVAMGWDDPDLTVGKLMRLFRWFDQQTVDGNAPSVTPALLDRIIGVTGFVQAVADVGWLVINSGGVSLQNFDRHNGATAKSRALTAKRVATHRGNGECNASSNGASVTPALAREEKRREEVKEEANASLSGPSGLTCPHREILKLYAKRLPQCGQHRTWDGVRQEQLRARWHQAAAKSTYSDGYTTTEAGLAWWDSFFAYVGSTKLGDGFESEGRSWRPDLEWITKQSNFQKIIDGKYDK